MTTEAQLSPTATRMRQRWGAEVFDELVLKAGSTCYLCEESMDIGTDPVEVDHVDPHGSDEVANLHIAHGPCNSLKSDLPVDAAKRMIKFRKFCERKAHNVSFDDVLDAYLPDPKRQPVVMHIEGDIVRISFQGQKSTANLMTDPATGVRFFFCDVPVSFICNDADVQPRKIDWSHAWSMAQDFENHPVHEPSSCRIDLDQNGRGRLGQFDGQHKTTAQIILGRKSVQTEVYISPSLLMIRDLIVSIQNKIRKLPLQAAIAITKLADVCRDHWEKSGAKSESEFIKSYRSDQQANAKKQLIAAIYQAIIDDSDNQIDDYVQKQRARRGTDPISMNNLTNIIFRQLVCQEPQKVEVGSPADMRGEEAKNVIVILNQLTQMLLSDGKWESGRPRGAQPSRDHRKAQRFFTPGAVRYWAPTLKRAINNRLGLSLGAPEEESKPLLRQLSPDQRDDIAKIIRRLVEHPVWVDDVTPNIDGTLNENSYKTSARLFLEQYPIRLDVGYLVGLQS